MITHPLLSVAMIVLVSSSMIGVAVAAPGEGPPDDMPAVVPDFVSDLLNSISEFIGGVLETVRDLVGALVPGSGDAGGLSTGSLVASGSAL